MKKIALNMTHFITLVEEGRLKIGKYEYERIVDAQDNSHYYRYYRKGDEIVSEEVTPFN
jgi:hypothetical protein